MDEREKILFEQLQETIKSSGEIIGEIGKSFCEKLNDNPQNRKLQEELKNVMGEDNYNEYMDKRSSNYHSLAIIAHYLQKIINTMREIKK